MATAVAMPKLGMTMEEGQVVEWPIPVGAPVAQGQIVLVIESEKAEFEVESPAAGVVRHVYVEAGESVPCGTLLGVITTEGEDEFDADAFAAAYEPPVGFESKSPGFEVSGRPLSARPPATAPGRRSGRVPITPAARVLARRLGVDLDRVVGTGPGGRVVRADVQAWADRRARLRSVADGVALDVVTQGTGEPVVLLPGFGSDVSVFAPQIAILAEHHTVIGINPRGVAGSDAPTADAYEVEEAARDAAAVISEPAHVVGASHGTAVAIELALLAPAKVRSLTLMTPFVTADARLLAVCASWATLAAEVSPASLASTLAPWMFSTEFLADESARGRALRGLATMLARVPAATLRRTLEGLRRWSGTRGADLARISAPTLVVVAGADLLTPAGAAVAAAIPNAHCVEIPGAGHAVGIEAPQRVTEAIAAHLTTAQQGAKA